MIDIIREETKEINFMKKASTVNEAHFNLFSIKATTKGPTDRLFFYKDGWFGLWLDYPCFYESMDASTIKQTDPKRDGQTYQRTDGLMVLHLSFNDARKHIMRYTIFLGRRD